MEELKNVWVVYDKHDKDNKYAKAEIYNKLKIKNTIGARNIQTFTKIEDVEKELLRRKK